MSFTNDSGTKLKTQYWWIVHCCRLLVDFYVRLVDFTQTSTEKRREQLSTNHSYSSRRRTPCLSWHKAELLGKEHAILMPAKADIWFCELEEYLVGEVEEGASIMKDRSRIFNTDEIGFPLLGKTDRVLAPKGSKDVYQQSTSNKTK